MSGLREAKLGLVIDRFYEAAMQPQLWRTVLHETSLAVGAEGALLHGVPSSALGTCYSEGLDEVCDAYIREGWVEQNPRPSRGMAVIRAPDDIVTEAMCFSEAELDRIPFNADLIGKHGFRWFAGVLVGQAEGTSLQRSLDRRRHQGQFTSAELAALKRMVPHLQAAGRVALRLADAHSEGMLDAFDRMNCGGILLDYLGQVTRLNQNAQRLLGRGLVLSRRNLSTSHRQANAALQRLIGSVVRPGPAHGGAPAGAVAVPRPQSRPFVVYGAPVTGSAYDLFQRAKAMLMVIDPDDHSEPAEPILRQVFGLTPAEARLAVALASGRDLTEIAHSLHIETGTVRTQLKAIFAKTGTHRQGELVALLARFALRPTLSGP